MLIDQIKSPQDLKKLTRDELKTLANQIREFLIDSVFETGGHLSSNLGAIELTLAIHYVFDAPKDKIVWDVGHQTYTHKIITGRKNMMSSLRKKGGLSGFPNVQESIYDNFGTGHSSTSISAAFGMSEAFRISKSSNKAIAVIGDGGMTGGMAFEGLNNAGASENDFLVILNDNDMSISKNVGALNNYLSKLLSGKIYGSVKKSGKAVFSSLPPVLELARKTEEHVKGMVIPGTLFEEFGFNYIGPIDGHDIDILIDTLSNIKSLSGPQFLHIATKKGFGYTPAESDPNKFHGISKKTTTIKKITYTEVFSEWLLDAGKKNKQLCAITPAMADGSGLTKFAKKYPKRFFDVGIAEQHALTFAAGLSSNKIKPVVAIYSSFLQRGYDQFIHDIALQNIPMLFAIDRAGIVGADGPTHSGNFDISFLRCIPNIVFMAPSNESECYSMLEFGYNYNGVCAVRYPRGNGLGTAINKHLDDIKLGKSKTLISGKKIAIFAFGPVLNNCIDIANDLNATLVDMRFIKPIDESIIKQLSKTHDLIVTVEDNTICGGAGSAVLEILSKNKIVMPTLILGIPDKFVDHGSQEEIYKQCGLDKNSIFNKIVKSLK
ncbi:MAG: 1-deoxy-D-xylulose-5-phosphate synthase [Betaproteobacteria bacterium]|nr:1-deoxy-D-xylulose-5-phosphate synthase [Betaproteobacteria bacterium]